MEGDIIDRVRDTADQDDIDIAVGIVAAARGVGVDEALQWLRLQARARQVPVVDLARSLLARPPWGSGGPAGDATGG
ncbi:ANTAR domain-containing protein [Streptomyces sp. BH105]|uniref:ANTAR domain-containing protein n=1 Tax=Streptomyces sp. BH105 TaxID=3410408 RepID=UPI003CE99271